MDDIVEALKESTHLGVEIQLKILQLMPVLVQNYGSYILGETAVNLLQVCVILQGSNKIPVVINTASATLQQLLVSLFERVPHADAIQQDATIPKADVVNPQYMASVNGDAKVAISPVAYDAYMIFIDLCNLIEHQRPVYLKINQLPETFGLELLESILTNHSALFLARTEFANILRTRAVPLLLRALSEKRDFPITVRSSRILYLLIKRLLPILKVECEVILSLLTHLLDVSSSSYWKRTLCMEIFQGLFVEFDLLLEIYNEYDLKVGRRSVLKDLISKLESICHEDPSILGLGEVSTEFILATDDDNEAQIGISSKTSSLRVSLIDLLDKGDSPPIPRTYLHYLILSCLNSLSEGISKTVLGSSKPTADQQQIHRFTDDVWTYLLSCFNIYCHSTMDNDLYHNLIRSIQRFTHVIGHLQLEHPRDQFLSLLGGMSVVLATSGPAEQQQKASNLLSVETLVNLGHQKRPSTAGPDLTARPQPSGLSSRNITCFRALLNLAITLGPTLKSAWNIIFETLQTADYLINGANSRRRRNVSGTEIFNDLSSEYNPLITPFKRMVEMSKDLHPSALLDIINSIVFISRSTLRILDTAENAPLTMYNIGNIKQGDDIFLIELLKQFCMANDVRLTQTPGFQIWPTVEKFFLQVITSRSVDSSTRRRASEILGNLILELSIQCTESPGSLQMQTAFLQTNNVEVQHIIDLYKDEFSSAVELDIHVDIIDNVNNILKHCGSLIQDWDMIFAIIDSVFEYLYAGRAKSASTSTSSIQMSTTPKGKNDKFVRLIKSAFQSLQLICTDFLFNLPMNCFLKLINTLYQFCYQERDLNISLTSISFFWTVTDHLSILAEKNRQDIESPVDNERALLDNVAGADPSVHCLWVVCLLKLSSIASTARSDVRNGSVQILFRIFDSHGASLPPNVWRTCQLVILPSIMSIKPDISTTLTNNTEANPWVETMSLILNGLGMLYSNFNAIFIKQDSHIRLWNDLMIYYRELVDYRNALITGAVYSSLKNTLMRFLADSAESKDAELPSELLDMTWDFWTNQELPDVQDLRGSDLKAVQESLTTLVELHLPLYRITPKLTIENTRKGILLLRECASFKLLPPYFTDRDQMTPLQNAALARVAEVQPKNAVEETILVNVYRDLLVLPFINDVQKVPTDANLKRPTYVSLSLHVLRRLSPVLDSLQYFDELVSDRTIENLLEGLLIPMSRKFDCPLILQSEGRDSQLWQIATRIFLAVCRVLIPKLPERDQVELESTNLRKVIADAGVAILTDSSNSELRFDENYEQFDIDSYEEFIGLISSGVAYLYKSIEFWGPLLRSLFTASLVCKDDMELVDKCAREPLEVVRNLSNSSFYGTTKTSDILSRTRLAYKCMDELFRLSSLSKTEINRVVSDGAVKYALCRSSLILYRFVANHPLRGRRPLPKAEKSELVYALDCLTAFSGNSSGGRLNELFGLLSRCISTAVYDPKVSGMLTMLMLNLGQS